MRDNDDFDNIPSMVPSRDDVNSRQQARQQPDLVKPVSYAELVKVSTWPVRIMLALLTVSLGGAAYYGYELHQQTLLQLEQSNSRSVPPEVVTPSITTLMPFAPGSVLRPSPGPA
jgi:hypothetical protein